MPDDEQTGSGHRTSECWNLSGRDIVPDLAAQGSPRDAGAAVLYAMLQSDGAPWTPPYEEIRSKVGVRKKLVEPELQEQADSRLRTWMAYFRGLGLLYDDEGILNVTPAGNRLRLMLEQQYRNVDDFAADLSEQSRRQLALSVIGILARYQLRNPSTVDLYPTSANLMPLWAIWKSMRELDNKIHWEEIGRVLTRCLRMEDLPTAIDTIRQARSDPDYNPDDVASAETHLGSRCPDLGDDQQDRIIVWLSRAGFKDLLIERRNRGDGYRYLQEEYLFLLDLALDTPPKYHDFTSDAEYYQWLGSAPESVALSPTSVSPDVVLAHVLRQCRRFGPKAIVALVGSAGVGKTRMAYLAAQALTHGVTDRMELIQFHAAFTYEEFIGGLAPNNAGGFEPSPGVLLRINKRALSDPDNRYVLVIDELSRADVGNVLGELLTYVEYRDRSFRVAGLDQDVRLAENLVILVTLNEKDRSVINLDDAAVRRLRMIEIEASGVALDSILTAAGMSEDLREEVVTWFEALPKDAPFGHGLFDGVLSEADLFDLWHEQIRFFLQRGGLAMHPNPALIESGFKWKDAQFARWAIAPNKDDKDTPTSPPDDNT